MSLCVYEYEYAVYHFFVLCFGLRCYVVFATESTKLAFIPWPVNVVCADLPSGVYFWNFSSGKSKRSNEIARFRININTLSCPQYVTQIEYESKSEADSILDISEKLTGKGMGVEIISVCVVNVNVNVCELVCLRLHYKTIIKFIFNDMLTFNWILTFVQARTHFTMMLYEKLKSHSVVLDSCVQAHTVHTLS